MARTTARWICWLLVVFATVPAFSYSLLTHEELIDLTWDDSIVPLLLSRYPKLTPAQLEEARAYAYGGCVVQDIGYYPFGQVSFSNLTHYVRTGDFIVNLFRDARNADELAFAIGALSHYIGDSYGHPLATNLSVPVEFPSLEQKYGRSVDYAEGRYQHVQTEFAFDINEVAHRRVAPIHYFQHVGLGVPIRQLSLAFYQTYGLSDNFTGLRRHWVNVPAYRFAVRRFIPRIAYALSLLHRRHEPPDPDTPEARELHREIAAEAIENNWHRYRDHAGVGTLALAGLIFILPKVGVLKLVDTKGPTEQTESEYVHSVAVSATELRRVLRRFTPVAARHAGAPPGVPALPEGVLPMESRDPHHPLPNRDLDTGRVVRPGGYPLTDATFASLLHTLTRQPQVPVPTGIKEAIEAYYAHPDLPIRTKRDPAKWQRVQADLVTLKSMPTSPWPEAFPIYEEGQ